MPNWCGAAFNVRGDEAEMDRFFQKMFRTVEADDLAKAGGLSEMLIFDFNGIIPMPSNLPNGYEGWAVNHWGCKWNAQNTCFNRRDKEWIWFQFDTPWDFPTPVFDALAAEFPSLVFAGSAFEESGDFELTGEFNGKDDWGPGEIHWIVLSSTDEDSETDDDTDE